jgi:uncharacterized protein
MSEREVYPHGVPCWVDVASPDPESAQGFYGGVFGWEFEGPGAMPGEPPGRYYVAKLRGRDVAGISSQPPGAEDQPSAWNTYVRTDSADATAEAVLAAGGRVATEPFDAPPAGRMAVLADPAGAVFCAWEAGDREGAQLVNEPSAWSMSALLTPDPDAAKEFYGSVFGWETEVFGPISMWRLPGFVGGEPEQPVPRDVVANMVDTGADSGAPAHWRPDFWIADADAAAATATELGGTVIDAPADVPGVPFRSALLADGNSARFSVSQLVVDQASKP